MTKEEVQEVHRYIIANDLLTTVEVQTKRVWKVGSRATYYNAIKDTLNGEAATLVGRIMLMEARSIKQDHEKENNQSLITH